MLIKYTPEQGDAKEWEFKPAKLMSAEAEAIEGVTDWTYEEFGAKFLSGSALAKRALVWVLLKRENPSLRFSQVSYPVGAVTIEFDAEELGALREGVENTKDLDEKQREHILEALADGETKAKAEESPKGTAGKDGKGRKPGSTREPTPLSA